MEASVGMSDKLYKLQRNDSSIDEAEIEVNLPRDRVASSVLIEETLHTADELVDNLYEIEQLIEKVKNNHNDIIAGTAAGTEPLKRENEELHEKIKTLSHSITNELKRLKEKIDEEGTGPERNSAQHRIKKAQYQSQLRQFREIMMTYNSVEEDYREKNKNRIQREFKVAGKDVSLERIDEMLDKGNPQALSESIIGSTMQKKRLLSEVESRHLEIQQLERNIIDLHDMFYDLQQLVLEQGEMVNQIEYNVDKAAVFVQTAQENVRVAKDYHKKNRKLKYVICCVVTSVAIVLLIIAIIVIAAAVYFADGR